MIFHIFSSLRIGFNFFEYCSLLNDGMKMHDARGRAVASLEVGIKPRQAVITPSLPCSHSPRQVSFSPTFSLISPLILLFLYSASPSQHYNDRCCAALLHLSGRGYEKGATGRVFRRVRAFVSGRNQPR